MFLTGALPFNGISSTVIFGESTGPPLVSSQLCQSGSTSLLDCILNDLSNSQGGEVCDEFQINFGVRCDSMYITNNTSYILLIQIFNLLVVKKVMLD